jgi:hypothetical protein
MENSELSPYQLLKRDHGQKELERTIDHDSWELRVGQRGKAIRIGGVDLPSNTGDDGLLEAF